MSDDDIKDVKIGDRLFLYRKDIDTGAPVSVGMAVATVIDRGICKTTGDAYGASWCLVKDEVGRTRVLESDRYLEGLGHPTHDANTRIAGVTHDRR